MTDDARTVWQYTAAADRETLISGTLAWLMDPQGNHGLGDRVVSYVIDRLDVPGIDPSEVQIHVETGSGRGRRFDIALSHQGKQVAVLEVKAKTFGGAKQLRSYDKDLNWKARVARVAFDEWNFPDLEESERESFPLIRFSELCDHLETEADEAQGEATYFVRSLVRHLRREEAAIESLRGYLILEDRSTPPRRPSVHRYSDRTLNHLYWTWFRERWKPHDPSSSKWIIKSERSGVWYSNFKTLTEVPEGKGFCLPGTRVVLPGRFRYGTHLEIFNRASLFDDHGKPVGHLRMWVSKDHAEGKERELHMLLKEANEELEAAGLRGRKSRPSRDKNFTILWRPLTLEDLRFTKLSGLLTEFLDSSRLVSLSGGGRGE